MRYATKDKEIKLSQRAREKVQENEVRQGGWEKGHRKAVYVIDIETEYVQ